VKDHNFAGYYSALRMCVFLKLLTDYRKNIFGDVTHLLTADSESIAEYIYDAWGNHTIKTDGRNFAIAMINPFRYRGYYYDIETGLYYLNTRYYDPETGRFVSPDDISILDESMDFINGLNLYSYCGNNPVNRVDHDGRRWWRRVLIGVAVIAVLAVATVALPGVGGVIAGAALGAAIKGAVSGAVVGGVIGGISSAATGGNFFSGMLDGASSGFMLGAAVGGAVGLVSSGIAIGIGATKIVGAAQVSSKTLFHSSAVKMQAGKMATQFGKYSKIAMSRSMNTAGLTATRGAGTVGRKIPDVIGVARRGNHLLVEVASRGQTHAQMATKLMTLSRSTGANWQVINWAARIARFFRPF